MGWAPSSFRPWRWSWLKRPDVIFCAGDIAVRAVQQATTAIPILAVTDDMVGAGLVRSLAEPGGNTTGVSILATELDGKRQDLLIETRTSSHGDTSRCEHDYAAEA
jgi:hypothetical protein